jgi:hypothetical protein
MEIKVTPNYSKRFFKVIVKNFLNVKDSKRFRNMVADLMPDGVNHVEVWNYRMNRKSGWGHYERELHLTVNGDDVIIKHGTTSAVEWDTYHDLEYQSIPFDNFVKSAVLDTIERNIEVIESQIEEQ